LVLLAFPSALSAEDSASSDGAFGLRGKLREKRTERELAEEIKSLAGGLGHTDFRVREDCTLKLIAIGKKNKPARNQVGSRMNVAKRHKDPEVSQRAKRVLKAIFPPPKIPAHLDAIARPS